MTLPKKPKQAAKKTPAKKIAGYFGPYVKGRGDGMKQLYDNIGGEYAPGAMGPPVTPKLPPIKPTAPIKVSKNYKKTQKSKSG